MNRVAFSALSFLTLLGQSCSVTRGDHTYSTYTKINTQKTCKTKAPHVYLFHEGEETDFDYTKLGEVEAHGGDYASNREVLDCLKLKAWSNCANGLIQIKSGYKTRTKILGNNPDSTENYNSKYYSALAVDIEMDSTFIEKYGMHQDTSFVKNVSADKLQRKQSKRFATAISVFFGTLGLVIGAIKAKNSSN